jgi:pyridoxal phosphate enzyme (YggS family)
MAIIEKSLQAIHKRIAQAALNSGRVAESVRLLAVSKTWPTTALREAYAAGQTAFGESYLQEALGKITALADLPLEWHFIGPIQSNKTRPIAENFAWVHSVDRIKVAERLAQARPETLSPLNICLQVNVSGEDSKSGVAPQEVATLARAIAGLPRLKLRGLMTIPRPTDDIVEQRAQFQKLRKLLDQLNAQGLGLDTLSMGMSDDLEAAIMEGATIVRVGSAIFGNREKI